MARIPVILDTDIGSDIDDTWALLHLLRSPELDLRLVLTATGEAAWRASVTAKFLTACGRTDVAVGLGKDFGPMGDEHRHQGPWTKGYDLASYPGRVFADGIGAMIDLILASPEPVTVLSIAPTPNLALALAREPRIASRCRFVGMQGSFDIGYNGSPGATPETNVRLDPASFRAVLSAPWKDILLTPLDTCGLVTLKGEKYRTVWQATRDPGVRALLENYCVWAPRVPWMHCDYFTTASSVLFDCVAVWLAYAEDLVEVEEVAFEVTDDGLTRRASGAHRARVAMRWRNLAAFEDHLVDRLLGNAR
jgi:inosine-uridine nucleoside N-ribohydrolase